MIHLIIILCGIFALICSIIIDANRFIKAMERKGITPPKDQIDLVRLWYDYFDDKL